MNYLICFLFLLSKDTCRGKYLNEVFKTPIEKEYFLVIKSRQGSKILDVVLTNVELKENLEKEGRALDEDIVDKIKQGQYVLAIKDSSKWFTTVKRFNEVSKVGKKGEEYFIERYFDKYWYLKQDVPFKYLGQIIQTLTNWNILISEPEGNLHISRKQFCN